MKRLVFFAGVLLFLVLSSNLLFGSSAQQTFVQEYSVNYLSGANVKFRIEYPTQCLRGTTFAIIILAEHILGSPAATNVRLQFIPSPPIYISIAEPSNLLFLGTILNAQVRREYRFSVNPSAPIDSLLQIRIDTEAPPPGGWQTLSPDLTCTVGGGPQTTTLPPQLTLSVAPTFLSLKPGDAGQVQVQITVSSWPPGQTISLSAVSSGSGVLASISPSSLTGSGPATLTITTSPTTAPGPYQITIQATSSGVTMQSGSVSVAVESTPLPWWLTPEGQTAVITAVGVVAVAGIVLFTRRRMRPPERRVAPTPVMPPPMYGPPKPAGLMHRPQVVEVKKKEGT